MLEWVNRLAYKIEQMKSIGIMALACLLAVVLTQQIIDYTHAQSLENTHFDLTRKYDIRIYPEYI